MGQEWAKFLNPNQSAATASQTPSNELRIPTSPDRDPQPSMPVNHVGSVSDQLIFSSTGGAQPLSHVAMAQGPSSDFLPVSMDVSEGKQPRVADQAELVACSHGETQTQLVDRRPHQRPPPSFAQVRLHSNHNIYELVSHCCQFDRNQSPGLGSFLCVFYTNPEFLTFFFFLLAACRCSAELREGPRAHQQKETASVHRVERTGASNAGG